MKRLLILLPLLCLISCIPYNDDIETIVQIQDKKVSSELIEQTRQQLIERLENAGFKEVSVEQGEVPIQFLISAKIAAEDNDILQQYHGVFRKGDFGMWHTYRVTDTEAAAIAEHIKQMPEQLSFNSGQYSRHVFAASARVEDLKSAKEELEKRMIDVKNVKLFWSAKPDIHSKVYKLYAIDTEGRTTAPISNKEINGSTADLDQTHNIYSVNLNMNPVGMELWSKMTRQALNREIAIVLDGRVNTAPTVRAEITGGRTEITGNFTYGEALQVSDLIGTSPLPYTLKIIDEKITLQE